jgi:uncharacterized membrane protein YoaK (UPF0700 family)
MESQNGQGSGASVQGTKHPDPGPPAEFAATLPVFLLVVAGGAVDAMIILAFNVLTAAQTGNTILMATSIASGDFANGLESAISLTAFLVGVVGGARLIAILPETGLAIALWLELALLGFLLGLWMLDLPSAVLIAIAAGAMGVQSAVTLSLKAGFTTTYITGVLASLGDSLGRTMTPPSTEHPPGSVRKAGLTWVAYLAGGTISGMIFLRIGHLALVLPIVCVGIFVYHHNRFRAAAV